MEGRATWTAVASRNAMPVASTVTTTSHRPGAVPKATGGPSRLPVTGQASADGEVGQEVGRGGHDAGCRERDDPRDHDVAGHTPAHGREPPRRADAHDRGGRDVRRRDRDG